MKLLVTVLIVVMIINVIHVVKSFQKHNDMNKKHFVVTNMVQCQKGICNAVLEMDDITILIPTDTNNIKIGDKIYLTK